LAVLGQELVSPKFLQLLLTYHFDESSALPLNSSWKRYGPAGFVADAGLVVVVDVVVLGRGVVLAVVVVVVVATRLVARSAAADE
jgi:hypothetical protein